LCCFVKLNNKVKEAFSTMDVYLKKRWDLIPNIVETVKGYAKHEKDTLKEVVELRNSTYDKMSDEEKIKTNEQLSSGINKIMALAEAYPDLKANENFKDLSKQLTKVEDDIANSRKYYNGVVRIYNTKVEMFPSNIFAGLFGYKSKAMFQANENERENVKVEL
jgi:LemA protein